jgi:2-polyprenyl-3-methyl-5-hydroxy-6-metoxy-1,4-benzoquinol methylase
MQQEDLEEKLRLQEAEYRKPTHWQLGRADNMRYRHLSHLLARKITKILRDEGSQKVHIIDIGCGDGAGTFQLWEALRAAGYDTVVDGHDYSERAIAWSKEKTGPLADETLRFHIGAAEDAVYDTEDGRTVVILLREVIEHLTEQQIDDTLAVAKRHFSNPYLLLTTPSLNSPVESKHLRHYTAKTLRTTLERNDFKVIEINGFGFRPKMLFHLLVSLKTKLNRRKRLWRLTGPLWRACPPGVAMTLYGIGKATRS